MNITPKSNKTTLYDYVIENWMNGNLSNVFQECEKYDMNSIKYSQKNLRILSIYIKTNIFLQRFNNIYKLLKIIKSFNNDESLFEYYMINSILFLKLFPQSDISKFIMKLNILEIDEYNKILFEYLINIENIECEININDRNKKIKNIKNRIEKELENEDDSFKMHELKKLSEKINNKIINDTMSDEKKIVDLDDIKYKIISAIQKKNFSRTRYFIDILKNIKYFSQDYLETLELLYEGIKEENAKKLYKHVEVYYDSIKTLSLNEKSRFFELCVVSKYKLLIIISLRIKTFDTYTAKINLLEIDEKNFPKKEYFSNLEISFKRNLLSFYDNSSDLLKLLENTKLKKCHDYFDLILLYNNSEEYDKMYELFSKTKEYLDYYFSEDPVYIRIISFIFHYLFREKKLLKIISISEYQNKFNKQSFNENSHDLKLYNKMITMIKISEKMIRYVTSKELNLVDYIKEKFKCIICNTNNYNMNDEIIGDLSKYYHLKCFIENNMKIMCDATNFIN